MSENIIRFERGIPGFLDEKEFIIQSFNEVYDLGEDSPFYFMKSVQNKDLSFIIINPFLFFPDYEFQLSNEVIERLGIQKEEEVAVFSIITLKDQVKDATANLLGPIVINTTNRQAEQLFLDGTSYTTKHPLFAKQEALAGGE